LGARGLAGRRIYPAAGLDFFFPQHDPRVEKTGVAGVGRMRLDPISSVGFGALESLIGESHESVDRVGHSGAVYGLGNRQAFRPARPANQLAGSETDGRHAFGS
jgi:hypothetical protein